jgi:3-hydroxymyristoyl/3-hydroxydecanoyl-(acyl carrier protein) dehydratase
MLLSWLGVDLENRGERVYRLLGCEFVLHGAPPEPGETLAFDLHIDRHARMGEASLCFFHGECRVGDRPLISIRNGRSGFFRDDELAASQGLLWDPVDITLEPGGRFDAAPRPSARRIFSEESVASFADGNAFACFGEGFEPTRHHTRTPTIHGGLMRPFQTVQSFAPNGGPWRRGYTRAVRTLSGDEWFFAAHFKNDPCMPGTLMIEGAVQAMAFHMAACGFTIDRDGWRFEAAPGETYDIACRGQATPSSRELVYEVFVRELIDGPTPTLFADLLCTIDGKKAAICRRMGLRLVPDWPFDSAGFARMRAEATTAGRKAAIVDGIALDTAYFMGWALGRPSLSLGPRLAHYDDGRKIPRLPTPPFLLLSRVVELRDPTGERNVGTVARLEYDMPDEAWFLACAPDGRMPASIMAELAFQCCGWMSYFAATAAVRNADKYQSMRMLDGDLVWYGPLPSSGIVSASVELIARHEAQGNLLHVLQVEIDGPEGPVLSVRGICGLFPQSALPRVGDPRKQMPSPSILLPQATRASLPAAPLRMIHRVTHLAPEGGNAGLGLIRGERDIDPADWYFKAHFFQDPVQPGSLGMQAMDELMQLLLAAREPSAGTTLRFERATGQKPTETRFRGQVLPDNVLVIVEAELTSLEIDGDAMNAVANATLSVDGRQIYVCRNLAISARPRKDREARDAS